MAYSFSSFKEKAAGIAGWLSSEYDGIRTSRATPSILDNVSVEAYGSKMPLKQVAAIASTDARTLYVTPYDPSQAKAIEKSIGAANLGLSVSADDRGVRVSFPELTTERRTSLVKLAKEKLEEGRIRVRKLRDETWKDVEAKEKQGGMGEDEKFRLKDELQKQVDELNQKLASMEEKKEKEILS